MINATFKLGGELVSVKVEGNNLAFFDIGTGQITTLEGIRFSKAGVLKEFPDLEGDDNWKKKALDRLKEHMKKKETEWEKMLYIKEELNKFGYDALYYQRAGHRNKKFE